MADDLSMECKRGVVGAMWRLKFTVLVLRHLVDGVSGSAYVHLHRRRLVYEIMFFIATRSIEHWKHII
jgi:hypothetical protein